MSDVNLQLLKKYTGDVTTYVVSVVYHHVLADHDGYCSGGENDILIDEEKNSTINCVLPSTYEVGDLVGDLFQDGMSSDNGGSMYCMPVSHPIFGKLLHEHVIKIQKAEITSKM